MSRVGVGVAALRDEFVTLARAAVENDCFAFDWSGWRLATFILSHGDEGLVGRAVERRLRRVVATFASLPAEETGPHSASDVPVSSSRSSIRSDLGQILLVAGAVAERIPKSLILDVFRIEARFSSDQATASMVRLLARVAATDIDATTLSMDDADKRIEAACLVASLGSTPTRVQIVGDGFKDNLEYPALLTRLSNAARHLWSDELLRRIVQALVRGWGHKVSNIRELKLAELAAMITKEQAETILAPLLPRLTTGEHHVRQSACLEAAMRRFGVEKGLWPAPDAPARLEALSWTTWSYVTYGALVQRLVQTGGRMPELTSEIHHSAAKTDAQLLLGILAGRLARAPFLLGAELSLADLIVACVVGYGGYCGAPYHGHAHVSAWMARCQARPSMQSVNG